MIATVTLTYNRLEALKRCVEGIRRGVPHQIIVVDNHSTDGTAVWLSEQTDIYTVRLPENRGVVARNYGFRIVRPEVTQVCQIDDDVVMQDGWPAVLSRPFNDPNVVATGSTGGYIGGMSQLGACYGLKEGTYVDTLTGYCWMIHKSRIEAAGYPWAEFGYDEAYGMRWHEESDLQCEIRYRTSKKLAVSEGCAVHVSLAGEVDMALHNANLDRFQSKWRGKITSEKS